MAGPRRWVGDDSVVTAGPVDAPTTRATRGTLGDALSGRDNALNFVRLVLASLVIVGHTWPLGGFGEPPVAHMSSWAVNGFFAISGYLIAGSRARIQWWGYLWRRALRIFPAFWTCLMVTAFVIAPIAATVAGETWSARSGLTYVFQNLGLLMQQQTIDHTLLSVHYPLQWNGSLWTLAYEFAAYLGAGLVLGLAWVRRHRAPAMWVLLGLVLLTSVGAWTVLDINNATIMQGLRLAGFYVAGMAIWAVSDRIPVTWWLALPSAVIVGLVFFADPVIQWPVAALPAAYLMLWAGSVLPVRLGSTHDISYGIYIYAFPIQQLLAVLGAPEMLGFWGYACAALALTVPIAMLSWFLVERPAVRLRRLVRASSTPI